MIRELKLCRRSQVFLSTFLPFFGFGFLDNSLMLIFGDQFDQTVCAKFGFSTLAAAALGNTASDIAGVFASNKIEAMAGKLGVADPKMDGLSLKNYVRIRATGSVFGVVAGCLVGMWPLLFYDKDKKMKDKKNELYTVTVEKLCSIVNAKNGCLMLVENGMLSTQATQYMAPFQAEITTELKGGICGYVAKTGDIVNIPDIKSTEFYDPAKHDNYHGSGFSAKSILCVPIVSYDGKILGAVELANKSPCFTSQDEDLVAAVCSHIAAALTESQEFGAVIDSCAASIRSPQRKLMSVSEQRRVERLFEDVMSHVRTALKGEASMLMLVDKEKNELFTRSKSSELPHIRQPMNQGIMGIVASSGYPVMINEITKDPLYDSERYRDYFNTGINVRSVLAHPIFDSNRQVIGVLEVINKKGKGGFDEKDSLLLKTIATHVALNLEGEGSSLKKAIRIAQDLHMSEEAVTDGVYKPKFPSVNEPFRLACTIKAIDNVGVSTWLDGKYYIRTELVSGNPKKGKAKNILDTSSTGTIPVPAEMEETLTLNVPPSPENFVVVKLYRSSLFGRSYLVGEFARSVDGIRKAVTAKGDKEDFEKVSFYSADKSTNLTFLVNFAILREMNKNN
jgi:GAF domain-containing protein